MYRLGIIGIRGQAARWIQAARSAPGWKVGMLYHANQSRLDRRLKLPQTHQLDQLTDNSDAILVSSPTPLHLEQLKFLSKRFRGPILVEKPIVGTFQEAQALLKFVPAAALRRIYVAHNWRSMGWVQKIQKTLKEGSQPRPISAEFQLSHDFAFKPGYRHSWRSRWRSHPVGPAETQGIHFIDLVHLFFGPVKWVGGQVLNLSGSGSAPDTATLCLATDSGVTCSMTTSFAAPAVHYARVVTSREVLTYQAGTLQRQKRSIPPGKGISTPPVPQKIFQGKLRSLMLPSLKEQLSFLRQVLSKKKPHHLLVTAQMGIANVIVLEAFSRSLKQGEPYALERIPMYKRLRQHLQKLGSKS